MMAFVARVVPFYSAAVGNFHSALDRIRAIAGTECPANESSLVPEQP